MNYLTRSEAWQRIELNLNFMTIYGLKGLIEALKKENKPGNKYLIEFYEDLYQEQLDQIANKVARQLDQEQQSKKAWFEFLAK